MITLRDVYYTHNDHLGSAAWITDQDAKPVQYLHYLPYGQLLADQKATTYDERYKFIGKERDWESGYDYFGARYYIAPFLHWMSVDPLADKYPGISPYAYCAWNPVKYMDSDGEEPNKAYIGRAADFRKVLDNSPSRVGLYTGQQASTYMIQLSNTKFSFFRIIPTETGYYNKKKGRYIYTEKAGWLDMAHFMFYAGRAYKYKSNGEINPISKAVQDGYHQENLDSYLAPHSAYSYEDLPTDKIAAIFGVMYFNPNSQNTLGEQIENYLNIQLKATDPNKAPNYDFLPLNDEMQKPSITNKTTKPIYTTDE